MSNQNGVIRNQKGFVSVVALLGIAIGAIVLLFVPNPLSTVAGIGVKPNTIVQKQSHTETIVPLLDKDGNQVAFKTVAVDSVANSDKAPKSWINDLLALPRLWLFLMLAGCFCPALGIFMGNLNGKIKTVAQTAYDDLTGETKRIVKSVKLGLEGMDAASKQKFLDTMSAVQDQSTKDLVKELLKG